MNPGALAGGLSLAGGSEFNPNEKLRLFPKPLSVVWRAHPALSHTCTVTLAQGMCWDTFSGHRAVTRCLHPSLGAAVCV